jgi:probable phosphoglycerate mutase
MTRFVLVRHGETEWNRVERFRGRRDVPLNETGLAQAAATARRVAEEFSLAAVYASPLSRAATTAQALAGPLGLPVAALDALADIDYGEWEGLSPEEARHRWPELVAAWYATPESVSIPGGEDLHRVRVRAMGAVAELAARHPGQTVALVSHTVVNRLVLLGVLGLGNSRFWRLRQDTCAINVFEAEGGDYTLVRLNDTCHLRPGPET